MQEHLLSERLEQGSWEERFHIAWTALLRMEMRAEDAEHHLGEAERRAEEAERCLRSRPRHAQLSQMSTDSALATTVKPFGTAELLTPNPVWAKDVMLNHANTTPIRQ